VEQAQVQLVESVSVEQVSVEEESWFQVQAEE
jgi:hypothetical protein